MLEGGLPGEHLRLQRDAKHLMSPRAALLPWSGDCLAGSDPGAGAAADAALAAGAARRRLRAGSCAGERGELRGAAGHQNEAAGEAWEDDDNKTLDFPFLEKSLGVTDALCELLLRDRVDSGRCKVTLQSENLSCAQTHGEGWAEILGFQTQILKILG